MPQETGEASEQKIGFQMGMSELEESQAKGNDFAEITDVQGVSTGRPNQGHSLETFR